MTSKQINTKRKHRKNQARMKRLAKQNKRHHVLDKLAKESQKLNLY